MAHLGVSIRVVCSSLPSPVICAEGLFLNLDVHSSDESAHF
jgi:hypothetical protein